MSNQLYPKIEKLRGELNLPYLEAEDKTKLYYRAFLPRKGVELLGGEPEGPQKILLCIHGLGGYSGDSIELGERLVKLNIAVYALDLRGHGLSQKEEEKYFNFSQVLSDTKLMINFLRESHKGKPIFLLGESMGGIVVLNLAIDETIEGLILAAAGIKPNIKLSPLQILGLLSLIPVSLIFKDLKLINMEANWDKANNDPEAVKRMKEDPLLLRRVSIAFLLSIAKYHRRIMRECVRDINIPTLILQGTADDLVSYKGAEEFYRKLNSRDKEIKLFEGASHGLFADEKTEEVMRAIEEWFKRRD